MKKPGIILIIIFVSLIRSQTFGRLDMSRGISSQGEMQAMESFEETFALEDVIDPAEYILGPGDELGLNILTSENVIWPLTITPTGDLFIPSVGVVHVAGISLEEAIQVVSNFINTQAYPNAKVSLVLINLRRFQVQVTGAFNSPGFITISSIHRLSDVIKSARDFHQLAREFEIIITHKKGKPDYVNYLDYIRNGQLENNPMFIEGDRIYVPFGNIELEGIVIRGSITGTGYDIIEKGETLESFLQRRAKYRENTDLKNVTITRISNGSERYLTVNPAEFKNTILKAGDVVDILSERGVMVNGFVQMPGGYNFLPGYTAADYISMAGGNLPAGDPDKVMIRHQDGRLEKGQAVVIRRGDVVVVPRTTKSILFGETSVLQIAVAMATLMLTYIAAGG